MSMYADTDEKEMNYWPYCRRCHQPFDFDHDAPFAHCKCGTTEWGNPRPAAWIPPPFENLHGLPAKGEVLGAPYPSWPAYLVTFEERLAYQLGIAHARTVDKRKK